MHTKLATLMLPQIFPRLLDIVVDLGGTETITDGSETILEVLTKDSTNIQGMLPENSKETILEVIAVNDVVQIVEDEIDTKLEHDPRLRAFSDNESSIKSVPNTHHDENAQCTSHLMIAALVIIKRLRGETIDSITVNDESIPLTEIDPALTHTAREFNTVWSEIEALLLEQKDTASDEDPTPDTASA